MYVCYSFIPLLVTTELIITLLGIVIFLMNTWEYPGIIHANEGAGNS